jgi:hypothetical protein
VIHFTPFVSLYLLLVIPGVLAMLVASSWAGELIIPWSMCATLCTKIRIINAPIALVSRTRLQAEQDRYEKRRHARKPIR